MNLDIGDRVVFTNTVRFVKTTEDGRIIEYGPVLDNKYMYVGSGRFENVDQPHHTIDWFVDGRLFNGTYIKASYEIVFCVRSI